MKKLFIFAAGLITLASCTNNDFVGDAPTPTSQDTQGAIVFGSGLNEVTRANYTGSAAATKLNNKFVVEGIKKTGSTVSEVFDNYNVNWIDNSANTTLSNTANWEYVGQTHNPLSSLTNQTIKYWDYSASQYDFWAYSLGGSSATVTSMAHDASLTTEAYKFTGTAADLSKVYISDLVTAYNPTVAGQPQYAQQVTLTFRSLVAKIRLALYETVPGYSVKEVKFYTDDSKVATDGKAYLYTSGTENVFNTSGDCIVKFPTTGQANVNNPDYNKAHVSFTAASEGTAKKMDFGALANYAGKDVAEKAENVYLGRTSNTATFAGTATPDNYYTIVLPNENGSVLNLKVDYTLLSVDGSRETIKVTGAKAMVPAAYAQWKSGYAYTYLFKISDKTNGVTNPDLGPEGLYPITFDAVVIESEDGVQETITTVSDPSITTYAEGKVVTANNEYTTGIDIYISGVASNGTTSSDIALYSATLKAGSVSVISEATAKLAYEQGKTDNTSDVFDKTDVTLTQLYGAEAVTSVPAVDGNTYAVNAVKFTPSAAGTYVARYGDVFKVIKVVAP